jgi:o-succinylbenzoate synthase
VYNVALASLPRFAPPSDITASARYYVQDVVAPNFVLYADGTLGVPTAPGLGVAPDPAALAAVMER